MSDKQKPGEPVARATDRDIRLVCAYAKDHFKRDPMDPTRYERAVERLLAKLDSAPPQPERDHKFKPWMVDELIELAEALPEDMERINRIAAAIASLFEDPTP